MLNRLAARCPFNRRSSTRTTEKQNVSVVTCWSESTQTVVVVLEWLKTLDIARRETVPAQTRPGWGTWR